MEFAPFVLAASTADLADEPAARDHADALELRLDLAAAPLEALSAYDGELPVIATNRLTAEGGEASGDAERLDTLEAALGTDAVAAVDVELATVRRGAAEGLLAAARDRDVAVIVSAHDFAGTPAPGVMAETLRAAAAAGDLAKLAVTAVDAGDVLSLLEVTWELASDGVAVATMAMGEAGRHSRAITPIYGSRLGYAPVRAAEATAPGQYDLETLSGLLTSLGVERAAAED